MAAPRIDTQTILKKLDELPSLPAIVYELSRVINDPMSSTVEIEKIMSQDIGMTTKVLKLANSAYYAIPGGVTSLSRAIAFIGFDTVHQLVLSASIIKALEVKGPAKFDINEFWKHSIAVAIASEVIAKHIKNPNTSEVFTCGLVHDIGKLALYIVSSDGLIYITEEANKNKKTFYEIEKENDFTTHAELGKLLSEKWQLPKIIQAATYFHHENDMSKRNTLSNELNQVVDIVSLANLLIHALKFGNSGHSQIVGVPNDLLARLMIQQRGDMPTIIKAVKTNLENAVDFIKMIGAVT